MKYIVWGTGVYCKEKIDYLKDGEVIAFVEREKCVFRGMETILPSEIERFQFDKLIVMSNHYLKIIPEIITLGILPDKIIPGIMCKPYFIHELEIMSAHSTIDVNKDGSLRYKYNNLEIMISKNEDWESVKRIILNEENSNRIKKLDLKPIGKLFGIDRGGSIGRYYINKFIEKNREFIRGNVLEIGDRTYSEKYIDCIEKSYCLHFETNYEGADLDFYGDLRDGTNIKRDFYDCVILTQVLNYVEKIERTPQILLDSIKEGGVILLTVSAITPVSRYDMDRWGYFWNFTAKGIISLFSFKEAECDIEEYGNFKAACAFLGGMSCIELTTEELEYKDEDFPIIVAGVIKKVKEE